MYAAKRSGKNRYHWFDPNLEQRLLARNDSLNDIARALSQRSLFCTINPRSAAMTEPSSVPKAAALAAPVLGTLPRPILYRWLKSMILRWNSAVM